MKHFVPLIALGFALLLTSCYARGVLPMPVDWTPWLKTDPSSCTGCREIAYQVTPTPEGFLLGVYARRYQAGPALDRHKAVCLEAVRQIAAAQATQQGRAIQPITDDQIKAQLYRDGFRGITACDAKVPVVWASDASR